MACPCDWFSEHREETLIGVLWAVFIAALLFSGIRDVSHAVLKVFAEGNSAGKSTLLLGCLPALLTVRRLWAKRIVKLGRIKQKNVMWVFLAILAAGWALGLVIWGVQSAALGLDANGAVAHVTNCGSATCWEVSYLQHNHWPKVAVYQIAQLGIPIDSGVDNAQPLYEILPNASLWASAVLLIVALTVIALILLVCWQKEFWKASLMSFAGVVALFSMVDGGIFSIVGVIAVGLVAAAVLIDRKAGPWTLTLLPFGLALFVAFLPNLFLGSWFSQKLWLAPVLLITGSIGFSVFKRRLFKAAFCLLALYSLFLIAGQVHHNYWGDLLVPGQTYSLLGYGVTEVPSAPELTLTGVGKAGWYFTAQATVSRPMYLRQLEQTVGRQAGYMHLELDYSPFIEREVKICPIVQKTVNFRLISIQNASISQEGGCTVYRGAAAVSGPHLALEAGSLALSQGIDAIVISSA